MSEECRVRLASAEDFAAVVAIERECAEASHWTGAMWRDILEQSNDAATGRTTWIAESRGEAVGFAVVQCAGGGAELENLAVRLGARLRGVGSALLRQGMLWAAGHRAAEMHLEVRASNTAALRLYAGLGFVEQARRRGYYGEPVEDGVVMMRTLEG